MCLDPRHPIATHPIAVPDRDTRSRHPIGPEPHTTDLNWRWRLWPRAHPERLAHSYTLKATKVASQV